jgi:hypothetical protein
VPLDEASISVVYRARIGKIFDPGRELVLLFRVVVELKWPRKVILGQEPLGYLGIEDRCMDEEALHDLLHNVRESTKPLGKYEEAEHMYRETLELREKMLGRDHPSTLRNTPHDWRRSTSSQEHTNLTDRSMMPTTFNHFSTT